MKLASSITNRETPVDGVALGVAFDDIGVDASPDQPADGDQAGGAMAGRLRHCASRIFAAGRGKMSRYYLCAGNQMMADLGAGLALLGVSAERICSEAFGAGSAAGASGQRILIGGHEFLTAGEPTLFVTLEANRCAPGYECRAGTCGQCRMSVEKGEVRWLIDAAIPRQADEILPCICVAARDLRLRAAPAASRAAASSAGAR